MLEIIVDAREHVLIEKLKDIAYPNQNQITGIGEDLPHPAIVANTNIKINTAALLLGDVLLKKDNDTELILFERKSFPDLLASIKDGRYDEQSHRIIHTSGLNPHNVIYIIEGMFSTLRSPADKKIILSAMTSLSYFKGFSVFRTATILETAELVWSMATKIQREFEKGKSIPSYSFNSFNPSSQDKDQQNETAIVPQIIEPESYGNFVKKSKRENITPENIGEILLSQIPGISSHIATEILKHFGGSFSQFILEIKDAPEKLDAIYLESKSKSGEESKRRKLSSAVIQSILRFLRG